MGDLACMCCSHISSAGRGDLTEVHKWWLVQRNYRYFLAFLFTTTALDLLVLAFSIWRLVYLGRDRGVGGAFAGEPAAVALAIFTFAAFWCCHIRA
jgi:hypothetical protein